MKNKNHISVDAQDWSFYDYFDTIVHRRCHPDSVKMLWANHLSELFPELSPELFWNVRVESEQYIAGKRTYLHEAPYFILTNEIYSRLCDALPCVSEKEFYDLCLKADIEAECSVQYLDKETLNTIKKAKEEKRNVAVVTDFYLPQTAFDAFFAFHGIDSYIDKCFVSSDLDARKADGSLYDLVLNELQCQGRCTMIGDNQHSDFAVPTQKGIQATHRENTVKHPPCPTKENIRTQMDKLHRQSRKQLYGRYAFYCYYFTEKLAQEVRKQKIGDVFFLAREGQPMKRMFDRYVERTGITGIKTHYLCVSRAATFLAAGAELEEEGFSKYFAEYPDVAPADFLYSLGFDSVQVNEICQDAGILHDQVVKNLAASQEMQKLRASKRFRDAYARKRKTQKDGFIAYLDSFGVDYRENGLCIVDVGWKGSIQDNIFHILDREVDVVGYYIGLTGKTFNHIKNRKKGLAFSHFPCRSPYCEWMEQQTFLIEQLLSADHGPTLGYVQVGNAAQPVLGDDPQNAEIFQTVGKIQESWLSTFDRLLELFRYSCYDVNDFTAEFAAIQLEAVLCRTSEERKYRKEWAKASSNNFGAAAGKAVQRSTKEKIKFFLKSFRGTGSKDYLKIMYALEQITGKLKCGFMEPWIERITFALLKQRKNHE